MHWEKILSLETQNEHGLGVYQLMPWLKNQLEKKPAENFLGPEDQLIELHALSSARTKSNFK